MSWLNRLLAIVGLISMVVGISPAAYSKGPGKNTYRMGKDDVISVLILAGGEKQVEVNLVVSGQGTVNVPLVGTVTAKGLTAQELEKKIYIPLERDFFVNPQIHIKVEEYHSLSYFIAGAVKEPGMYELNFEPSLMDLIVKAGGVEEGRGNIAYIFRDTTFATRTEKNIESKISEKESLKINLIKLLDQGDMSENIMLKSGDTVYIPLGKVLNQTVSKVYVQGQVKEPGMFDFQPGMTVLSACILAGGFSKYAAPARSRIVRNEGDTPKTIKVNLDKIIEGKIPDIQLKPGDRIHVPESWF